MSGNIIGACVRVGVRVKRSTKRLGGQVGEVIGYENLED